MTNDRLEELLVLRSTQALDEESLRELDRLLASRIDLEGDEFDRAANTSQHFHATERARC
jgi:hypothetical protein